jgi:hypothetical protein
MADSSFLFQFVGLYGLKQDVFEERAHELSTPLLASPLPGQLHAAVPCEDPEQMDSGNAPVLSPYALSPFVFPSGIWLVDESFKGERTSTAATHLHGGAQALPSNHRTAEFRDGLGGRGVLHSFVVTSSGGAFAYGHVLTRYYPLNADRAVAILRMQAAAKMMDVFEATAEQVERKTAEKRGTPSPAPSPILSSIAPLGHIPDIPSQEAVFSLISRAHEPLALCILTEEPLYDPMRALLSSFDSILPPGQRLEAAHARYLYRLLVGDRVARPLLSAVGDPYDPEILQEAKHDEELLFGEERGGARTHARLQELQGAQDVLIEQASSAATVGSIAADNELQCIVLPWLANATHAGPRTTDAPGYLPITLNTPTVTFVPPSAFSYEIPQVGWTCPSCRTPITGVTRVLLADTAVSALQAQGVHLPFVQENRTPPKTVFRGPLQQYLRCVETKCCVPCTAQKSESAHASELVQACLQEGALHDPGYSITSDPLWMYVQDSVLPELRHVPIPPRHAAPSSTDTAPSSSAPLSFPNANRPSVPAPFTIPSATGLPPLGVDPRQLFSRLSPANIIALVTALLCERNILVVSKDTTILPDIMTMVLALIHPFSWAGVFIPVIPAEYPLGNFLEAPLPVFIGCHPSLAIAVMSSMDGIEPPAGYPAGITQEQIASSGIDRPQPTGDTSSAGVLCLDCRAMHGCTCLPQTFTSLHHQATTDPHYWDKYEHILNLERTRTGTGSDRKLGEGGEAPRQWSFWQSFFSVFTGESDPSDYLVRPSEMMLESSWGWSGVTADDSDPEDSGAIGARRSAVKRGGKKAARGDGGNASQNSYDSSFVIVDIDADALSPNYLPPTHLLPARLSLRLWRAIISHANVYAFAHPELVLPPKLPDLPVGTTPSEATAAYELWCEMARRASDRGWGAVNIGNCPQDLTHPGAVDTKHTQLYVDSLFFPFGCDDAVNTAEPPNIDASEGNAPQAHAHMVHRNASAPAELEHAAENVAAEDKVAAASHAEAKHAPKRSISAPVEGDGPRKVGGISKVAEDFTRRNRRLARKAPVASLRTLDYVHSDEEDDDDEDDQADDAGEINTASRRTRTSTTATTAEASMGLSTRYNQLGSERSFNTAHTPAEDGEEEGGGEGRGETAAGVPSSHGTPKQPSISKLMPKRRRRPIEELDIRPIIVQNPWNLWRSAVTAIQDGHDHRPKYVWVCPAVAPQRASMATPVAPAIGTQLTEIFRLPGLLRGGERASLVPSPPVSPAPAICVRLPSAPIHLTHLRLEFLNVMVSLFKAFRIYMKDIFTGLTPLQAQEAAVKKAAIAARMPASFVAPVALYLPQEVQHARQPRTSLATFLRARANTHRSDDSIGHNTRPSSVEYSADSTKMHTPNLPHRPGAGASPPSLGKGTPSAGDASPPLDTTPLSFDGLSVDSLELRLHSQAPSLPTSAAPGERSNTPDHTAAGVRGSIGGDLGPPIPLCRSSTQPAPYAADRHMRLVSFSEASDGERHKGDDDVESLPSVGRGVSFPIRKLHTRAASAKPTASELMVASRSGRQSMALSPVGGRLALVATKNVPVTASGLFSDARSPAHSLPVVRKRQTSFDENAAHASLGLDQLKPEAMPWMGTLGTRNRAARMSVRPVLKLEGGPASLLPVTNTTLHKGSGSIGVVNPPMDVASYVLGARFVAQLTQQLASVEGIGEGGGEDRRHSRAYTAESVQSLPAINETENITGVNDPNTSMEEPDGHESDGTVTSDSSEDLPSHLAATGSPANRTDNEMSPLASTASTSNTPASVNVTPAASASRAKAAAVLSLGPGVSSSGLHAATASGRNSAVGLDHPSFLSTLSSVNRAVAVDPSFEAVEVPTFDESFAADEFIAEEVPPDAEPLLVHIVHQTQLFKAFVQDRFLQTTNDMFDKACFRRMFLRAWRHQHLSSKPFTGMLSKAIRGTLCKSFERRLFELRGNVLSYYRKGDVLLSKAQEIQELKLQLLRARRPELLRSPTDVSRIVVRSGGPDGSTPASDSSNVDALAKKLSDLEAEHDRLRRDHFRRNFNIIPGRTEVVIPTTKSASFASPYVFQLVNPSLAEMEEAHAARKAGAQQTSHHHHAAHMRTDATAAPAPGEGAEGEAAAAVASSAAAMDTLNRVIGGPDRDVLTLCADTSQSRREWIIYIKARLRTRDFPDSLNSLYLSRAFLGGKQEEV